MVRVFLCGPGGSGKTTLAEELRKIKRFANSAHISEVARKLIARKGLKEDDLKRFSAKQFTEFEGDILQAQVEEEEKYDEVEDLISDRSIIDCLAYTHWKTEKEFGDEKVREIEESHKDLIKNAIERYHKSLIVVVHPWNTGATEKDGIRMSMSSEECTRFTEILEAVLNRFKLGYLNVRVSSLKSRLKTLQKALQGVLCHRQFNLEHYMKISAKERKKPIQKNKGRNEKGKLKDDYANIETNETCFSFYLECNEHIDMFIRSVKIFQDEFRMCFSKLESKQGRFFQNISTEDLFAIEFDVKVLPIDVTKILLSKIFLNGREFSFLGCSSDGIKCRKAFLLKGDRKAVDEKLAACGEFQEIHSVSKRLARISLLFSSVQLIDIEINDDSIIYSNDILSNDEQYNFTDGCGGMSYAIRERIYNELSDKTKDIDGYLPAVYQFRLQGFKGIIVLDPKIKGKNKLIVRDSMIKFKTKAFPKIGICDFSRPYTYGHLNRQLIYLLSALGIPEQNLLELQKDHFDLISEMHTIPAAAIKMLQWENKFDLAQLVMKLVKSKQDSKDILVHQSDVKGALDEILDKFITKGEKVMAGRQTKEKLRIFVHKSRMLYGVCDQLEKLEYGQCYIRITINGVPKTITGKITSGRMPCYLLGDIRVLEAVDVPELKHLVDCIVFPTKGKRPHADEQAGGDLDGDKFFVTWDGRLIPPRTFPSNEYPAAKAKNVGNITTEKTICYFSKQNLAMKTMGHLANLYDKWANVKGPTSDECQRVGQLFGRAVDAAKSGEVLRIPESLRNVVPSIEKNKVLFVWQKMEAEAKQFKGELFKKNIKEKRKSGKIYADAISEEYISEILEEDFTSITEFQKFDFIWRYALNRFQDEEDALEYMKTSVLQKLNFSLFSSTEKSCVIDVGVPMSIVGNSLISADVLAIEELEHFQMLGNTSNWKLLHRLYHSEFNTEKLMKALTHCDQTFISFQMPDDVVICLQFTKRLQQGEENEIEAGTFRAIFISRKFDHRKVFIPDKELYYDLTENRLQIYRSGKKGSFLWLKGESIDFEKSEDMQDVMSVDLTSFGSNLLRPSGSSKPHPLIRKTPFSEVEIFATREHAPVYPDVLVGNEIEQVHEIVPDEHLENDFDRRDSCKILLDHFHLNFPVASINKVMSLLEDFVSLCTPWNGEPSEHTRSALLQLLTTVDSSKIIWIYRLDMAACLCRLNHQDLAKQILFPNKSKSFPPVSAEDLMFILGKWTTSLFVPPDLLVSCIKILVTTVLSETEITSSTIYLIKVAWSSFLEFVNDITLCKENLETSSIHNLKIDRSQEPRAFEENNLSVTFYRLASLENQSSCPSSGDFILLIRAIDWKRSKRVKSVSVIAMVDYVSLVPFTIKMSILDKKLPKVVEDDIKENSCRWLICLLSNANITLHTRVFKACQLLSKESVNNLVFQMILGTDVKVSPQPTVKKPITSSDNQLNDCQQNAVYDALANCITLIHGPPGTGKTKVACEILQKAAKLQFKGSILAVAETNTAADNMTRRLSKIGMNILRVGSIKYVPGDLYHLTVEGKLRQLAEQKNGKSLEQRMKNRRKFVKQLLDEANIVVTTCAGAGESLLMDKSFRFVLVDEATQTKEATVMCALAHKAEKLVMIGDPNQLGPLVKIEKNWNWLTDEEKESIEKDLENTLFHKLHKIIKPNFLDTQYRMHPDIAKFPSKTFYAGKLKSGVDAEDRKPIWSLTNEPVAFINIEGKESRNGTSYANEDEAKTIEKIVKLILGCTNAPAKSKDIAVLALYNGQVRRLRKTLRNIEVSSIDGFQGREAEIILVSTVRCSGNLGYSDDRRRLNVLLTRSKRALLVVGHRPTLVASEIWKDWIESVPCLTLEALSTSSQNVDL